MEQYFASRSNRFVSQQAQAAFHLVINTSRRGELVHLQPAWSFA
jgi:hypothetical protein